MSNLPLSTAGAATRRGGRPVVPLPRWKRALDLTFCLGALPAFALSTLFAAMLTSVASRGPIFFKQERVGLGGRRFWIYKFRTMHVKAPVVSHQTHFKELMRSGAPMQKLDSSGDARLIPGARLLRACGFDELPQIINVLRGEMSVVGPRPCIPYEFDHFTAEQQRRCNVVPGLTGLWQVSGKNRTTFDEMIQLDIRYTETYSLRMDLSIMIRTAPALLIQLLDVRKGRKKTQAPVTSPAKPGPPSFSAPPFVGLR